MDNCLDSYVVRIYRRNLEDPRQVVGLVEIVSSEEKKAFRTFDELREILQAGEYKRDEGKRGRE
jgi:5'-deoxynucleotidase YfbR-like HD superfamily hydrolase